MDKNWLIRTKSNHILGPVSKEKVQELYKNGSIKPDDEICSGNGFWFFVREDDMVARFLLGNEAQGFNPISEAKNVLTVEPEKDDMPEMVPPKDDITVVGGISLAMLANEPAQESPDIPDPLPDESVPALEPQSPPPTPEEVPELKKKSPERVAAPRAATSKAKPVQAPQKKQNYLKWLGILGFITLFCLIYFRKKIIRSLFQGEMTAAPISLFSEAHAQEEVPVKKKLLEDSITLDGVTFSPFTDLWGFKVRASLAVEELSCQELTTDVRQLGVVLYPPELLNERFLIKLRECVLNLPEAHALKRWLRYIAPVEKRSRGEQESLSFLGEVLNSRFNLITDQATRTRIINHLIELPEESLGERLLKSYLYLIVGNITKSDNLLRDFIRKPPVENWRGRSTKRSIYHRLASENIEQIIVKLANHPTDRRIYHLFTRYLASYYRNDPLLLLVGDHRSEDLKDVLDLRYIERMAPELVRHLRLQNLSEARQWKKLQDVPMSERAYWHWPFLELEPPVSEELLEELRRIESTDQLWFIYLMDNERLADAFGKKTGKAFLPGRRGYLHGLLEKPETFMLALFKLIELGDVDQELVNKVMDHLEDE